MTAHIEFRAELVRLREDIELSPESEWRSGALNCWDIVDDLVNEWLEDCDD